jgi:uncharacterized protein
MLIRFRAENFRSLLGEQIFSMVAASALKEDDDKTIYVGNIGGSILRTAAVYGANASGKTNLVKAIKFMRDAVVHSHTNWEPESGIPIQPFALNRKGRGAVSTFEVDVLVADVRYRYGFSLNKQRVVREWLSAYPHGQEQKWFERGVRKPNEYKFGRHLKGQNRTISNLTKRNSLFLSAAAQNNHSLLTPLFRAILNIKCIEENSRFLGHFLTSDIVNNPTLKNNIVELLRSSDTGIDDIQVESLESGGYLKRLSDDLSEDEIDDQIDQVSSTQLVKIHRTSRSNVHFTHNVGTGNRFELELVDESDGTKSLYELAGFITIALNSGIILVVDELESSLHPMIARRLVELFNSPQSNPNGAQLIFTTHSTNLLRDSLLRRDQIWFTEKDSNGATHIYPLTDFKARISENLERGYLRGRYGAIPFLGSFDFLTRSKKGNGKKKTKRRTRKAASSSQK